MAMTEIDIFKTETKSWDIHVTSKWLVFDWLLCVLHRIDNIQAMLLINARPAYVIVYSTIPWLF